jgi:hypothetical protein
MKRYELIESILGLILVLFFGTLAICIATMLISMLFDIFTGYDLIRSFIRPNLRELLNL